MTPTPPITYNVSDENPTLLQEPSAAYALRTTHAKPKVNTHELLSEGYLTLSQSKALIEEKIHNHFHN